MTKFFVFAGIGKVLIYILQKFTQDNIKLDFLKRLVACDLCLGFWIYLLLDFLFVVNLTGDWFYIIVISQIIDAAVTTFLMHLISIGWREKFSTIVIE